MSYIHSKLYPKVKNITDDISDLVFYINDIKPYHTKIDDVVVQYNFFENMECTIDENYNSIINFIINYHEDRQGYDVKRFDHEGYDGTPILVQEYYAKGYNEYAYDCEHYDALLNADYIANDSSTTIKTTIKEHLVIDMSRYKMLGLDYKPFDADKFDTIDLSILPEVKSFIPSLSCGDLDVNHLIVEWSGWDTSYFFDAFIESGLIYNPNPLFDDSNFHVLISDEPSLGEFNISGDPYIDSVLTLNDKVKGSNATITWYLTDNTNNLPVLNINPIMPAFDDDTFNFMISEI